MPILFTIVIIAAVALLVWYIMTKRNLGTISIYPESREAVPGDTITGDIHIKSNKEIDCEKIQLSVRVNEIWMQEEHDWDNDSSGSLVINGTRVLGSDNRVQTGNSKPVYHEVIELAGQTHLDSGKTSYTFEAELPTEDELVAKSHIRSISDKILSHNYVVFLKVKCVKPGPDFTGKAELSLSTSSDVELAA